MTISLTEQSAREVARRMRAESDESRAARAEETRAALLAGTAPRDLDDAEMLHAADGPKPPALNLADNWRVYAPTWKGWAVQAGIARPGYTQVGPYTNIGVTVDEAEVEDEPSPAIQTRERLRRYIVGGHGALTARSVQSGGTRFTFQFRRPKNKIDGRNALFVRWFPQGLDGPSHYLGVIWPDGSFVQDREFGSFQAKAAFGWLWQQAGLRGDLPTNVEVWHEGACAVCGRALTKPESIEAGMGPVCAARLAN